MAGSSVAARLMEASITAKRFLRVGLTKLQQEDETDNGKGKDCQASRVGVPRRSSWWQREDKLGQSAGI